MAPRVFGRLGAQITAIHAEPDGDNINRDCGATRPEVLGEAVRQQGADLGVAFDGDGDRLVMADANGATFDGDQLLYIIARFRQKNRLLDGGVVGTLMTNLGMEQALASHGIGFARAAVGDRYVLEKMLENRWQLGGENSGHIICLDKHTTGDGIVSALQVLHALRAGNCSLAELCRDMTLYPQVLINVRIVRGFDFKADREIQSALKAAETGLKGRGRVLLRASGTEPVLRVMVEGEPRDLIVELAETLARTIGKRAAA